jgi:anaerobic selenocysteine-containing dehydrogenase
VIDRVGESRTNDEVGAALASRLGLDMARYDTDPDRLMKEGLGGSSPAPAGEAELLHAPGTAVQFRDTFPDFEDRKARLAPAILRDTAVPAYRELDTAYPLALITPATHRTINSMFGEFNAAEPCVRIHPDDALARTVGDGDTVRMWNDLGALEVVARIDADLRPGVVSMPKGLWRRDVPGGLTANALVPDTLNDLAGGACFNDARVEIVRLSSG